MPIAVAVATGVPQVCSVTSVQNQTGIPTSPAPFSADSPDVRTAQLQLIHGLNDQISCRVRLPPIARRRRRQKPQVVIKPSVRSSIMLMKALGQV